MKHVIVMALGAALALASCVSKGTVVKVEEQRDSLSVVVSAKDSLISAVFEDISSISENLALIRTRENLLSVAGDAEGGRRPVEEINNDIAAIDRLLPGCHDLEELLVRLQREGYELKRGKYISARAPGQERFTRLKTLGADYAEAALTARMAGRARPSRQPKHQSGKISLLIDIQNNIKAQQSAGYRHWATIENLKRIAETSNFLTEHGIGSMEELTERCEAASASAARLKAELRETGARIEELTLKMKHVAAYRQLKPIYDRYQASKDKEKFLRGYEREIILFEAAARECKRLGAVPLPATERMQAEMDALTARRAALTAERQKARREEQDYAAVRRNVEEFLSPPRQAPARQKDMELE